MRLLNADRPVAGDELGDAELMRRLAAGDERALEALYDRYASAIMGLALKILGEREPAEEVVQEAFWRAWSRADSYRAERGAALSWLFGIAHHLAIDVIRRGASRRSDIVPIGRKLVDRDVVEEATGSLLRREQVVAALAELAPEQRQVLELAYFGGLTHRQIAEATKTALGTVHTRARLGLQKLRSALLAKGYEFD
ncbi:MAG: RNA polymerase sigma factor [Anaerolineales bacterium]